ncbi:MAG: cytochrome C oxidase subunit II [Pseudonocardiaceae bacterium]|nr:cytochrome C oxidase subunit II [Pseudonocardiaceae bacterium]
MGRNERTPAARFGRAGKVAALVGLIAVTASGCSFEEALRFGWPEGVTPQAQEMRQLWTGATIAALVMGVIVWGLILWAVAFHRKRADSDELPRQTQYNVPLELGLVVIPTIMVLVLFYFTATTETSVLAKEKDPDTTVDVTAFQWNWEFSYPGYETPDGQTVNTVGSSDEIPLLVLPTSQTIQYNLRSTDVIHSFWVPEFNFKRDVMPFPEKNNQDNAFQNRIDQTGAFVGRCAELCGTYHSAMNFEVRAMRPAQFDQYMRLRTQVNPDTGEPYTAREALQRMNCGELCSPRAVTTQPFNTDRTARTSSG